MSSGNYVTLDKVNFRPYIRPYLEKNQDIKSSYLFEFFQLPIEPLQSLTLSWRRSLSYRNQSNDLLCKSMDWFLYDNGPRHERVKEHLVAFSLTLFAYTSKLSLQSKINFFITNVCHFIHHARRKTTIIYKRGVQKIIAKEYKGRFFNDYVEVSCFIQA